MKKRSRPISALLGPLSFVSSLALPGLAAANEVNELTSQGKFCSATAQAVFRACGNEVLDDFWIATGICINESDSADRLECFQEARASRTESNQECRDQLEGRLEACSELGEQRYDPEFEPALFERNFANLNNPNRYFPLAIGSHWEFVSADERTKVTILNQTKLIDEVRCVVSRDEVSELDGGALVESTNDWFAQAKDGTVWYCGEETSSFETFEGDRPMKPERVSIDGSFKAGRDGDKPGIIFLANPAVGEFYVEESSLGNAEDATEVLSVDYAFGKDPELDELVPRKLAKLLCKGDCVVTRNFSLLEPDVFERKYYAPGIGVFLEVEPEAGEVVRLVRCNVDPRCALLPQP